MLAELRKSINSILYERTTSPLFGTFIISWCVSNWQIIYLTLFVSEDKVEGTKISFIEQEYFDIHHLVTYPLLSTVILITLVPFISNGAYWLTFKFKKWRIDQKNLIEKKQLLTLEQSIQIREELLEQEAKFEKSLSNKEAEIKQLKLLNQALNAELIQPKETILYNNDDLNDNKQQEDDDSKELTTKILSNTKLNKEFGEAISLIQSGASLTGSFGISSDSIAFLETNDIINKIGGGIYDFTKKGKNIYKLYVNN